MYPNDIFDKRILISPLNWGMGHVARCIPLISQLLNQNNTLFIACDEAQKMIFNQYFLKHQIVFIEHQGYPFKFDGKGNFTFDLLKQFKALKRRKKLELLEVEQYVMMYNIDIVLSDHRYGFFSSNCDSYFLTHQLNLPVSKFNFIANYLHKKEIKKFTNIWVFDYFNSSLAGKLSINTHYNSVYYIGPYSRFSLYDLSERTKEYTVIIVSGPSPYADIFFKEQIDANRNIENMLFIVPPTLNIEFLNDLQLNIIVSDNWPKIDSIILKSRYIISRSGYSTIMDLDFLNVRATLIPTNGQAEQIYLSKHVKNNV